MSEKGDSGLQAVLRDELIKRSDKVEDEYVTRVLSVIGNRERLLDIGCGTGHIIRELGMRRENVTLIGLDISEPMIRIADENTKGLSNVSLILADGLRLPFGDSSFDIVISRLADYSLSEIYRVLLEGGRFFEYGLGPRADREIAEFFPERIERSNFFSPENPESWTEEVSERVARAGFTVNNLQEYESKEHYASEKEVADLIEIVPLVKDFDRHRDSDVIHRLSMKYGDKQGIDITWHYYILEAERLHI